MDNNRGLLLFGLGCAAGVAAAMVLTSKSGRDAVDYLKTKADEGTRNLKETVDNVSDTVTKTASRGVKAVRFQTENVAAAVDAGKQAFRAAQDMTP